MKLLRRLGFALLVTLLLCGAAELAARVSGRGPATFPSPLPFQDVGRDAPRSIPGGRLWPFGRSRAAASPAPGVRVMLFGESAAEADGYTPWVGMGGVMERALRHALPEPVEVLNLATPGAGSRQIVEVVRASVSAEPPDVVVLYVGNNELHELRALKTVMPGYDARAELLRRRLWRSHAYRLLTSWLVPPVAPFVVDPTRWPALGTLQTAADAADRGLAMTFYEENLRKMITFAAGRPVVLATVAVNERWVDQQGGAEERGLYEAARAAEGRGDAATARRLYTEAQSVATRPVRALPETRAIARRVAADTGAHLCDVQGVLAAQQLPGSESFDDSCHPNAHGHAAIGAALGSCVLEAMGRPAAEPPPPRADDDTRLDAWATRRGTAVLDDGSPSTALRSGNAAFVEQDYPRAAARYAEAEARGADPGVLALDQALLALYRGDIVSARAQLAEAATTLPADVDLAGMRAALGR